MNQSSGNERKGRGFFVWGPAWFYSWPVRIMSGHDEYRRRTFGLVTWAGSLFYAWPHDDADCICATEPNDPYPMQDKSVQICPDCLSVNSIDEDYHRMGCPNA